MTTLYAIYDSASGLFLRHTPSSVSDEHSWVKLAGATLDEFHATDASLEALKDNHKYRVVSVDLEADLDEEDEDGDDVCHYCGNPKEPEDACDLCDECGPRLN